LTRGAFTNTDTMRRSKLLFGSSRCDSWRRATTALDPGNQLMPTALISFQPGTALELRLMCTASTGKRVWGNRTVKIRDRAGAGAAKPLQTSSHKLVRAFLTQTLATAPGLYVS